MKKKSKKSVYDQVLDVAIIVMLSESIKRALDVTDKEDDDKAAIAAHALYFVSAHYLGVTDPVVVGKYLHKIIKILSTMLTEEDFEIINKTKEKLRRRTDECRGGISTK